MERVNGWIRRHRMVISVTIGLLGIAGGMILLQSWNSEEQSKRPPQILTEAITFNNLDLPPKPRAYLFNTTEEWRAFKAQYHLQGLDQIENLVDFTSESFVFINGGSYLTPGNYLTLKQYDRAPDQLKLVLTVHETGKNCPQKHMLNYPTLGLKLKKFSGRLNASFQRKSFSCQGRNYKGIIQTEKPANGEIRL